MIVVAVVAIWLFIIVQGAHYRARHVDDRWSSGNPK